jgi:hypothetical protein
MKVETKELKTLTIKKTIGAAILLLLLFLMDVTLNVYIVTPEDIILMLLVL